MIDLLVLDVDGCMTDGKITYSGSGEELKSFDVHDGFAIVAWKRFGKRVAIITGRTSEVVAIRARELGIDYLYQGVKRKEERLEQLVEELGIPLERVAAIGDDLNDYRLLSKVALAFMPQNGSPHIEEVVDVVLSRRGGDGAIREMIEYLLEREGLLEAYLNFWKVP
ncbi:MAG: 3-deoxy-D-manno-octulosonate 8-phosphate phosphatase [Nitratiruptor sp.]|nr:3-deoxy-D-manno-octulosonate 8-phosphate phosphatase [Nitratiruptor sp.]NPA84150.1 HAD hydrolase family protein [Campylobacterota bacterium]